MKKIDKLILMLFLYGLPVVAAIAIFDARYNAQDIENQQAFLRELYNLGGLLFGIWMALAVYLSVRLLFSKVYRDEVLTKLCFFKERDEREVILSGKASKNAFLITLAMLILFFCLSTFQVAIYHTPEEKAINGKTGMISLGFGLGVNSDNKPQVSEQEIDHAKSHFVYSGFPFSKPIIFLIMILTQITAYNYAARQFSIPKKPLNS